MTISFSAVRSSENCPECGSADNTVINSRKSRRGRLRRRTCNECGERWTTVEKDLADVKRDERWQVAIKEMMANMRKDREAGVP